MHMGTHVPAHHLSHGYTWAVTSSGHACGGGRGSVGAALEPAGDGLAERAPEAAPAVDRALDVVLGAAELELAEIALDRPRGAPVTVERHADAARVDQFDAAGARTAELQVAVSKDDRPVVLAADPALVLGLRLEPETVVVASDAAVHVEDTVELGVRRQRVQPVELVIGQRARHELGVGLHHLGAVGRRLAQPPLAVAADPGRILQRAQALEGLARPRARRGVVAAEEERVGTLRFDRREHALERRRFPWMSYRTASTLG